jgi:hypothetical protein
VRFRELVTAFTAKEPSRHIGVTCADGFNASGYFIVQHMCEKYHCDPMLALQVYSEGRAPGAPLSLLAALPLRSERFMVSRLTTHLCVAVHTCRDFRPSLHH